MTPPTNHLAEIRAALQDRIEPLCRQLLPRGRLESGQWVSHNPTVAGDDRRTPALKVRVSGGDIGAWTDHRNGRDSHKGDAIGLVAYLNGTDTRGALAWARDWLGLKRMGRAEREAMGQASRARREADERRAERLRRRRLELAELLFMTPPAPTGEAFPLGPALCHGTMASGAAAEHARAYFAARLCPIERIAGFAAGNFRFSIGTEWWKGATWKTDERGAKRKAAPGPLFPAVHAAMRAATGQVTCCHFTFLDPVRAAKAPVAPAKLMFGEKKASVIEIAHGPQAAPWWAWREDWRPAPLVIAEGIETAASLAVELAGEARVWAAGDLGNIGHVPASRAFASAIYVARDNNAGNAQAQAVLEDGLELLERHGVPVAVMASHVGDDFNDLATGKDEA